MRARLGRLSGVLVLASALLALAAAPVHAEGRGLERPLILVHGWGPPSVIGFNRYVGFLTDDGIARRDIHVFRYSFLRDLATIEDELDAQYAAVAAKYPPGTMFDVIGHSTGDFVALYAAARSGFIARIKKYVGLSGIGHGWDCPACMRGWLGETERTLAPANNPFITTFYETYAAELGALDKCALFSPDDGLIRPYDSARTPDGVNVEVEGMRHLQSVKSRKFYELMKEKCYGGEIR
jgi:pimeloyl-ACP methyl ester carboxylesterase